MAQLRCVNTKFWEDPFIEELSTNEKLLFLYLITNSYANLAGIYEITIKRISFETGLKTETIRKGLERFETVRKAYFVNENYIVLPNWLKNQNLNSNMKKGVIKIISNLPIDVKIKIFGNGYQTITKDYQSILNTLLNIEVLEIEIEIEDENQTEAEYDYSAEKEILNSIYKLFDPKYYNTDKQKQKWLDTIRLLLNNDKYTSEQIIRAVTFARNDEFWKANLQTINSLRKKNADGVMKIDNILAKIPTQTKEPPKYREATFNELCNHFKHEWTVKQKLDSGDKFIIYNKEVKQLFQDDGGQYIREIDYDKNEYFKKRI